MSTLLSRFRSWRWPARVVAIGLAAGTVGFLRTLEPAVEGPLIFLLFVALWLGWGATSAAVMLLAGAGLERLRELPSTLAGSQAPRLVVALIGASLAGLGLILVGLAVSASSLILLGVGAAAVLTAHRGRPAAWPARRALVLVALAVTAFSLPREAGWYSLTSNSTNTRSNRDANTSSSCQGLNWDGPVNVASLGRDLIVRTRLTGNVGELVGFDERPSDYGDLMLEITGDVQTGWLGCLAPLVQTASFDTMLHLSGQVSDRVNGGSASCSVTGTIRLQVDMRAYGVTSCRDLRKALAKQVATQIDEIGRGLL